MKVSVFVFCSIVPLSLTSVAAPEDIRDIKPPLNFAADYLLLIIILTIIGIFGLLALFLFLRKKKRRQGEVSIPPPPAHAIAFQALRALKEKDLPGEGRTKEYYFQLSLIIRYYLENRFSIKAPEMTTDEFLYMLPGSGQLHSAHKELLKGFLSHCDLVKFAKYGPTQGEIEDSFSSAWKLVDDTKTRQEQLRRKAE